MFLPPNSHQKAKMSPVVWPVVVGCWPLSLLHLLPEQLLLFYDCSFLIFTPTNDVGHLNLVVLDSL